MKFDPNNDKIAFAQTTLKADGLELSCKQVSYGDSIEYADIEANSQMSLGTTAGVYRTDEGTLEIYADDFAELMEKYGPEFYSKRFEITNAYQKLGDSKLNIDTLVAVRFVKRSANDQTGPDGLSRTVAIKPFYIKWNGKDPLPNMPTGAS